MPYYAILRSASNTIILVPITLSSITARKIYFAILISIKFSVILVLAARAEGEGEGGENDLTHTSRGEAIPLPIFLAAPNSGRCPRKDKTLNIIWPSQ